MSDIHGRKSNGDGGLLILASLLVLFLIAAIAWGVATQIQDWRYKQAVIDLSKKAAP